MAANGATAPRRSTSDYSEVQASRLRTSLPLPDVLRNSFRVVDGPPSSATGNPGGLRLYFLYLGGRVIRVVRLML
ncbi:UNVERIFIED_CONTAM: Pyrophosphate--fructose 6-phosphate 1-phosphotransferase subunit beta 2 [Sesamum radiatum]|uniref:Pyrophosphate--fructose 6-phosphate 1-phosphotransferase subunit beta 2 n=1 Tax=Sesamum radiatum TaxID=300843 RepID=A0AAW2NUI0_SESRA